MRKRELMGLFKFLESQGYETDSLSKFIFNLKNENEELKSQLKGTTHCYDEAEHTQLKQENEELKKELEHCYCERTDCSGRIKDSKQYDSLVQKVETQQQEFIKYLKQCIENEKYCYLAEKQEDRVRKDILEEILQKYKEIIGGKNE